MPIRLTDIYNKLPTPGRIAAASFRGFYLRSWRYGPETDQLITEAHEHERWSESQWKNYRDDRLAYILHRSATRVPYYREQWKKRRRHGDHASWAYLENWPILEKNAVREQAAAFIADDCDPRRMWHEHTSGTTGKPLDLWLSRQTIRHWYALSEARWRRWYGVSMKDRWAILGGQLVTPVLQRRPPFWVWNYGLKQLYMSSYHLAPDLIPVYLDALIQYRITYLLGYTSSLYALAKEAMQLNRCDLKMTVVITNAEPLDTYQREVIEHAFQCPVRETYGMSESVAAAGECEHGRLHLWPEVGCVEVHGEAGPVSSGIVGDLICTGLLNADMPLVRYRVGDRGSLASGDLPACVCGRTMPCLTAVEGRSDDVLYTTDGRQIGRLDPVFKSQLPIREAQIVQETLTHIHVRCVPAPGFSLRTQEAIADQLRARMGSIEVTFETIDQVPRTAKGKFRAVVCNLSQEELARLVPDSYITRAMAES